MPAVDDLAPLRPNPWPITPFGPYRLIGPGQLEEFETAGWDVIEWIEANCVFTDDRWLGTPARLLPWQKQLFLDLFELVYDPALGRWRRRYRTALIGVPKKQGKTELMGFLADYLLLASGEPSPSIVAAAAGEDQADLIFSSARVAIEQSPTLAGSAVCETRRIYVPGEPNAFIRRIPANGGKFDGKRLMAGLCDELHEWQTKNQRKMYGMVRGALATREEPLHISITTAGEDEGDVDDDQVSPWLRLYRYGRRIEAGEINDPAFFFRWWCAPEGADYRDPAVWADPRVNPSFGVTVADAFYRDELTKRSPSEFRRYYNNVPVESISEWLEPGAWDACRLEGAGLLPGVDTWIGWDASTKRDSTAVVAGQWQEQPDGASRFVLSSRVWERPWENGEPVPDWKVPKGEVIEYVEALAAQYPVRSIAYDPAFISWVVENLEDRGLPMLDWPQTNERMVPATTTAYELIADGQLAHDGDPVLKRHFAAVKAKIVGRGATRLTKDPRGGGRKIDAAIAAVMAIGAWAKEPAPDPPSKYESEEMMIL